MDDDGIMNFEEFSKLVYIKCPPQLKGDEYDRWKRQEREKRKNRYYRHEVNNVIELMERMRVSQKRAKKQQIIEQKIADQDILVSDILIDKLKPWAEWLRKKLFGSPDIPFDWSGAVDWIENVAGSYDKSMHLGQILDEYSELAEKLQKHYGLRLEIRSYTLPYIDKNYKYSEIRLKGRYLGFEYETREKSNATGFGQAELVMFILTGIKPLLPRYEIERLASYPFPDKSIFLREVQLRIRARDFTFRELQEIYNKLRKGLRFRKEIPIKERDRRIYELVKELGSPPSPNAKPDAFRYWKEIEKRWQRKYSGEKVNWQGLKYSWENRLRPFINNLSISSEA